MHRLEDREVMTYVSARRNAQAANQARTMGDLPAGLARMVERMISPRLDWRSLLSRFLQDAARYDYAWMPPNVGGAIEGTVEIWVLANALPTR